MQSLLICLDFFHLTLVNCKLPDFTVLEDCSKDLGESVQLDKQIQRFVTEVYNICNSLLCVENTLNLFQITNCLLYDSPVLYIEDCSKGLGESVKLDEQMSS